MVWLLVALVAVLWLGRRRKGAPVVVIVIQQGDDGDGGAGAPITDRDLHDWISQ